MTEGRSRGRFKDLARGSKKLLALLKLPKTSHSRDAAHAAPVKAQHSSFQRLQHMHTGCKTQPSATRSAHSREIVDVEERADDAAEPTLQDDTRISDKVKMFAERLKFWKMTKQTTPAVTPVPTSATQHPTAVLVPMHVQAPTGSPPRLLEQRISENCYEEPSAKVILEVKSLISLSDPTSRRSSDDSDEAPWVLENGRGGCVDALGSCADGRSTCTSTTASATTSNHLSLWGSGVNSNVSSFGHAAQGAPVQAAMQHKWTLGDPRPTASDGSSSGTAPMRRRSAQPVQPSASGALISPRIVRSVGLLAQSSLGHVQACAAESSRSSTWQEASSRERREDRSDCSEREQTLLRAAQSLCTREQAAVSPAEQDGVVRPVTATPQLLTATHLHLRCVSPSLVVAQDLAGLVATTPHPKLQQGVTVVASEPAGLLSPVLSSVAQKAMDALFRLIQAGDSTSSAEEEGVHGGIASNSGSDAPGGGGVEHGTSSSSDNDEDSSSLPGSRGFYFSGPLSPNAAAAARAAIAAFPDLEAISDSDNDGAEGLAARSERRRRISHVHTSCASAATMASFSGLQVPSYLLTSPSQNPSSSAAPDVGWSTTLTAAPAAAVAEGTVGVDLAADATRRLLKGQRAAGYAAPEPQVYPATRTSHCLTRHSPDCGSPLRPSGHLPAHCTNSRPPGLCTVPASMAQAQVRASSSQLALLPPAHQASASPSTSLASRPPKPRRSSSSLLLDLQLPGSIPGPPQLPGQAMTQGAERGARPIGTQQRRASATYFSPAAFGEHTGRRHSDPDGLTGPALGTPWSSPPPVADALSSPPASELDQLMMALSPTRHHAAPSSALRGLPRSSSDSAAYITTHSICDAGRSALLPRGSCATPAPATAALSGRASLNRTGSTTPARSASPASESWAAMKRALLAGAGCAALPPQPTQAGAATGFTGGPPPAWFAHAAPHACCAVLPVGGGSVGRRCILGDTSTEGWHAAATGRWGGAPPGRGGSRLQLPVTSGGSGGTGAGVAPWEDHRAMLRL